MLNNTLSVILLAGGSGKRFGGSTPKQYTLIKDKPVYYYSLNVLKNIKNVEEIIVVAQQEYRHLFDCINKFANPGKERQDSVFNGLELVSYKSEYVLIHDSARPIINEIDVNNLIHDAKLYGAATLASPLTSTIKESLDKNFVSKTLQRGNLFQIHTPQVIRKDILKSGFEKLIRENLNVTDDVSVVELLNLKVKLTLSSSYNIKITTQQDLKIAELLIDEKL
jgi:2-C-methyl-D-erythritol 4-phosphate cytidylyltransferase